MQRRIRGQVQRTSSAWWRCLDAKRDITHRLNFWALILVVASFCAWVCERVLAFGFVVADRTWVRSASLLAHRVLALALSGRRFDCTRQLPAPPGCSGGDWRTCRRRQRAFTVEAEGVAAAKVQPKHTRTAGLRSMALDEGMKLTTPGYGASQLIPGVRRTAVGAEKAGRGRVSLGSDRGSADQADRRRSPTTFGRGESFVNGVCGHGRAGRCRLAMRADASPTTEMPSDRILAHSSARTVEADALGCSSRIELHGSCTARSNAFTSVKAIYQRDRSSSAAPTSAGSQPSA